MAKKQSSGKKRRNNSRRRRSGMITIGAAVFLVVVVILLFYRSCGSSHSSAVGVVQALVKAGVNGDIRKMKDCYGVKGDAPGELQRELDATVKFYKAHNTEGVRIRKSGKLFEDTDLSCTGVYIVYRLRLPDGQYYPCIGTYLVKKREGRYYVLTAAQTEEEMSSAAAEAYAKFMETDLYKDYAKEYDTFIRKNPGYEDKIAGKLN